MEKNNTDDKIIYLQKRVENIYDAARHRPCPKEREIAISYLKLAAKRFRELMLIMDSDIASMYAKSLEAIQREVDVEAV